MLDTFCFVALDASAALQSQRRCKMGVYHGGPFLD